MDLGSRPPTWKVLLAFSIVYFVWGSTFLAIRVGVHEVPPFLFASHAISARWRSLISVDAGPRDENAHPP